MKIVTKLLFILFTFSIFIQDISAKELCLNCHQADSTFSNFHDPQDLGCSSCHSGNPLGKTAEAGHQQMEAFPGRMATVEKSCGQFSCHSDIIPIIQNSKMNTVEGMINITRRIFEEEQVDKVIITDHTQGLQLKEHGADQYLRKLCVSCHLGNERKNHQQSLKDRGGGCSACHLKTNSNGQHPTLTLKVHNDRCFGCHSRSGRISLNYVGLAETDTIDKNETHKYGRLPDGRLVKKRPIDVHSQANMACIDCHTVNGVMGNENQEKNQLEIQCSDCHAEQLNKKSITKLKPRESLYSALTPNNFHILSEGFVAVTKRNETPLFHVFEEQGKTYLKGKINGKILQIPAMKSGKHHKLKGHERLNCDSCHSAWVPQCYGCHIEYNPEQTQWDHLKQKRTSGRWVETRWGVYSGAPALGVNAKNKITPFVPGMNFILKKNPDKPAKKSLYYASISPHTTQKISRSCVSCHQNDAALGIFKKHVAPPEHPEWSLPLGWIPENAVETGRASKKGERSLNQKEIKLIRVVGACLKCHIADDLIYDNFKKSLDSIPKNHSSYQ